MKIMSYLIQKKNQVDINSMSNQYCVHTDMKAHVYMYMLIIRIISPPPVMREQLLSSVDLLVEQRLEKYTTAALLQYGRHKTNIERR